MKSAEVGISWASPLSPPVISVERVGGGGQGTERWVWEHTSSSWASIGYVLQICRKKIQVCDDKVSQGQTTFWFNEGVPVSSLVQPLTWTTHWGEAAAVSR